MTAPRIQVVELDPRWFEELREPALQLIEQVSDDILKDFAEEVPELSTILASTEAAIVAGNGLPLTERVVTDAVVFSYALLRVAQLKQELVELRKDPEPAQEGEAAPAGSPQE